MNRSRKVRHESSQGHLSPGGQAAQISGLLSLKRGGSPEGDKSATRKQHYKHYEVPTDLLERWACCPPSPQGHRIFQTPDSSTPNKLGNGYSF